MWPLGPDRNAFERRIALTARIDHPERPFELVGVHLANGDPDLAGAQAEELLKRLRGPDRPVLVAGDLNLPSDHATLASFREAGYRDLVAGGIDHVLLDAERSGWWPLWIEQTERNESLDASRVATTASAARERGSREHPMATISDHPGLLIEFQLPVPPPEDDWPGDWQLVRPPRSGSTRSGSTEPSSGSPNSTVCTACSSRATAGWWRSATSAARPATGCTT